MAFLVGPESPGLVRKDDERHSYREDVEISWEIDGGRILLVLQHKQVTLRSAEFEAGTTFVQVGGEGAKSFSLAGHLVAEVKAEPRSILPPFRHGTAVLEDLIPAWAASERSATAETLSVIALLQRGTAVSDDLTLTLAGEGGCGTTGTSAKGGGPAEEVESVKGYDSGYGSDDGGGDSEDEDYRPRRKSRKSKAGKSLKLWVCFAVSS